MRIYPLLVTLVLLFALTVITRVLPEGYHPDSLVYMSMARNLAEGHGGFWELHFTETLFNPFYEHPPLGVYLMSVPFRLLGDSFAIDKLFGPFVGIALMLLMVASVRLASPASRHAALLAPFYFLLFPIAEYTMENNLLELPAAFFALASVVLFLLGVRREWPQAFTAALFVVLQTAAFLCKGPVALFPLALPFFYTLLFPTVYPPRRAALFYAMLMPMGGLVGAIFSLYPPAQHYLGIYIDHQLLASVGGARGGGEHFKLLTQLALDTGGLFALSLIAAFAAKAGRQLRFSRTFWLFVLIGLSASVPLEISPRQHDYYLFPALPYFAIALGLLFEAPVRTALKKIGGYRALHALNVLLLIALTAVVWQKTGTYKRHADFYRDLVDAGTAPVYRARIRGCADDAGRYEFFYNTELTGNLQRRYGAELLDTNETLPYFLTTTASEALCPPPQGCRYIGPPHPAHYRLYRCDDAIMAP